MVAGQRQPELPVHLGDLRRVGTAEHGHQAAARFSDSTVPGDFAVAFCDGSSQCVGSRVLHDGD
jgi:hypothetical protein